jgi:hypothetical protein
MTQALCAHMNNKKKTLLTAAKRYKKKKESSHLLPFSYKIFKDVSE